MVRQRIFSLTCNGAVMLSAPVVIGWSCTLRCPFCRSLENNVVDSRTTEDGGAIRRRRACHQCQKRFTSYDGFVVVWLQLGPLPPAMATASPPPPTTALASR